LWVNNGELKYSYALKSLSRVTPTILAENIVVLSNSDKIFWLRDGVLVNQFDILKNVERTDNVKIDLSNTTAAKLLDGTLVVGLYNGIVIWLKNGKKIYSYKANDVFESSPVVVTGETVAIATKSGRLLWLKNGKLLHQYDAPSLKADIVSLSDGIVVVTSTDEGIYWLRNGKVIFKNTDLDGFFTTTPVASLNNIVVVGSSKGVLYWLKDGKVIQKYQFPKWVISRPYFESEGNFAIGPLGEFLYFVSQVSGDLKK
ncbi:MAG: hypothetical protein NT027_18355, partial [Proteobacteria bacterium]|nr:hypothetical protein [Pseudomonadota bacterium]